MRMVPTSLLAEHSRRVSGEEGLWLRKMMMTTGINVISHGYIRVSIYEPYVPACYLSRSIHSFDRSYLASAVAVALHLGPRNF